MVNSFKLDDKGRPITAFTTEVGFIRIHYRIRRRIQLQESGHKRGMSIDGSYSRLARPPLFIVSATSRIQIGRKLEGQT